MRKLSVTRIWAFSVLERLNCMKSNISQTRHGPVAKHRVSTMIIASFLTILVCSFLFVLNLAHHNNTATASTANKAAPLATSQLGVYFGSADAALVKLNAGNGKLAWRYATNGTAIPAPATIANGIVYVGAQDGTVTALNATTGAV